MPASLRLSHKCAQVAFLRGVRHRQAKGRMVSIGLEDVGARASVPHHAGRRPGPSIDRGSLVIDADHTQRAVA